MMIWFQEKENHDGRESSSSPDMISFDLLNGDEDVEYHLEDIPSNAEEEERVRDRKADILLLICLMFLF